MVIVAQLPRYSVSCAPIVRPVLYTLKTFIYVYTIQAIIYIIEHRIDFRKKDIVIASRRLSSKPTGKCI